MYNSFFFKFPIILFLFFAGPPAWGKTVHYDLEIGFKDLSFTEKTVTAMAINGTIPGPILRFREGDLAQIRVHNTLDVKTSIHWHGILLPNRQDGVPYINNPPIGPGQTVTFEFPIKQTGTYWYHSHTGLQEQRGVYGSIVILPASGEKINTSQDRVIVLSDWTDENPEQVLRTLKSGNEYYSWKKGTLQSGLGAIQKGALKDYLKRSAVRMPPMDLSDIRYDRFLTNGKPEEEIQARPGEKVRLRIINASASTYFYLEFAGGPVEIVAADGIEVQPHITKRFLMAVAETYDLILTVPPNGSNELRATSQDGTGSTSTFIGSGFRNLASDVVKPNFYKMKMNMGPEKMKKAKGHNHAESLRPMTPYENLRATTKTAPTGDLPVKKVFLNLTGDMNRYVWSINGKILSPENEIEISRGEVVQFIIHNRTMMHHPMHLHGHFFRLLNKHGDYSPLKHTVDVPPNGIRVIEFQANENGDWFFHCHILYHALSGMARVVSYKDALPDEEIQAIRHQLFTDPWYSWVNETLQSHMTDGIAVLSNTWNIFGISWEIGWQNVPVTDYDLELTYDRYFNRMFSIFAGGNFLDSSKRGIFGFRYLLPFNFLSSWRVDSAGEFRITLEQTFQITPRFEVFGDVEYDTETKEEWVVGANIILNKNLFLVGQYHSDFGAGAGLRIRF